MSCFACDKEHHFPSILILICGSLVTGIGFVALLGWLTGFPVLSGFGSGRITMAPSTALLFLFYGSGVLLLSRPSPGRVTFRTGMVIGTACELPSLLFILSIMGIRQDAEHLGFRIENLQGNCTRIAEPLTDAEEACERAKELGIRLQALSQGRSPVKELITRPLFPNNDTYSQKGLGLGLSICHAILKRHN